jgi:hypothetical protein
VLNKQHIILDTPIFFGFTKARTVFRDLKFPDQVATFDSVSNNIVFTVVTFTGAFEVNKMNNSTQ